MNRAEKARKYWNLTRIEKRLAIEKERIRDQLISEGSFETREYRVDVTEQRREKLASISEFCQKIGRKVLEQKDLIGETVYKQVKIDRKN